MKKIIIAASVFLAGCVVAPPRVVYVRTLPPPPVVYQVPALQPVVSVYIDPPLFQPAPIRVEWAPPPMLVETVAPMPFDGAVWTGGYWVWEGNWVWSHGRWAPPPQPGYGWVHPYYENRGGSVIFINGFWAAPGVVFVAPSINVNIAIGVVGIGVIAGLRPIGPQGVFVPAPPGSRIGLIVPAPIGTAPAVVTSAPPIIREGMHINNNNNNNNNSTTINNSVSNSVSNVRNVTNITNVTIVAPSSATANGQAVNKSMPAQSHLAAAMPPVVKAFAPEPASPKAIPSYIGGRQPSGLPPPQLVRSEAMPAPTHPHVAEQALGAGLPSSKEMATRPTMATVPNPDNSKMQKNRIPPPRERERDEKINHPSRPQPATNNPQSNQALSPQTVKQQKPKDKPQKNQEEKKGKDEKKSLEKHDKG